ncbi:hypothetical protein HDU79_010550 [Rhizoclosmatium sp. JEL0117]|nr:hypothetical protein HDU79_010550 [Rhizoclosmatium sp. JEL0117]
MSQSEAQTESEAVHPARKSTSLQDSISTLCTSPTIASAPLEKSYRIKKLKRPGVPGSESEPVLTATPPLESTSSSVSLYRAAELGDPLNLPALDVLSLESQTLNTKLFRPLFDSTKKLVGQLHGLLGNSVRIEPTDAQNYTRLSQKINYALENQKAINTINTRLFAISYVTNLFNFAKTRHLQKSVAKGKVQILELQATVGRLEETIGCLNMETEAHKQYAVELQGNLENVKKVLTKTMDEYQKELRKQSDAIKSQQPVIDAIQRSKLRHDFLVDTSILILSFYISNTFLVEYPLHMAGQVLMKQAPKPRRRFTRQAAKAFVVWLLMKKFRETPWRRNKLVGSDPSRSFLFFEGPPIHGGSVARSRRSVEYMNGRQEDYSADDIPVQWMAWLRHTRVDPPSTEEIIQADAQRMRTLQLARDIDQKDEQMRIKQQQELAQLTAEAKQNLNQQQQKEGPEAWNPTALKK